MLVLARKVDQRIRIGDAITVTVVQIGPGVVRLGFEAPEHLAIVREELLERTAELQPMRVEKKTA